MAKVDIINNHTSNSFREIDIAIAVSKAKKALEHNIYYSGRVKNIILDENSRNFNSFGEWNGIGTIEFKFINQQTDKSSKLEIARPLLANMQTYPLVEEVVLIFNLPANSINVSPDNTSYYYLPISLWNHPHHNALPNPYDGVDDEAQQRDYTQGKARRVKDGSTEIDLNKESGGTFEEQTNVHPILPFAGDIIVEGRFGNSLRLGNTAKTESDYTNNWSEVGKNGNPITILRNGQPDDASKLGWLPVTEDINKDKASIYLTSNQKIPITTDGFLTDAFENKPEAPNEYTSNQIILNSGRLVLNSYTDSVVITGKKSVSISAVEDIGITSRNKVVIEGAENRLGGTNANYNMVRGQELLDQLRSIVNILNDLSQAISLYGFDYTGGAPKPGPLQEAGFNAKLGLVSTKAVLDQPDSINVLLSQVNKLT